MLKLQLIHDINRQTNLLYLRRQIKCEYFVVLAMCTLLQHHKIRPIVKFQRFSHTQDSTINKMREKSYSFYAKRK